MAAPNDTRQSANGEDSSNVDTHRPSLKEHTKAHSAMSNDCEWLHAFVSSDAASAGKISTAYLVRVYYKEQRDAPATTTRDFGTGSFALLELKRYLASKYVRAVILCHRDSSQVDPEVLNVLWTEYQLEMPFMRQHFDYKGFRDEPGCPGVIRNHLEEEDEWNEDYWTYGGRWNPIQLPSETRASTIRLSVDSECLSVCCRDGVVLALIRSKAVYQPPLSARALYAGRKRGSRSCAVDLFAATAIWSTISHEYPSSSSEFICYIVHFYARLLVLRCYEDYSLRHDTQPTNLDDSVRVSSQGLPYIAAMHDRRLELVKMKQNLSAYLGPLAPEYEVASDRKRSDLAGESPRQKLQSLLTDVEMLLSLYDTTMRIYEWHVHETHSAYKADLASEQLAEAKESKATAISFGKLSKLAFLYLPINFVCAMLGMNLKIFGQGTVPVWVFLMLVMLFALLTYLPILSPTIHIGKVQVFRLAYHLARRSIPAGFWFLAFALTHEHRQTFDIMHSGPTQVLLAYSGSRTKGWTEGRRDGFFTGPTWGSEAFWRDKVKKIYLCIEELDYEDKDNNHTSHHLSV